MHPVADAVRRSITTDNLLPSGSRVLIAVSGGADSVGLLHLLGEIAPAAGFTLAGIAHLNHGLRGAVADEDEDFCRRLAAGFGLPFVSERSDVRAAARSLRTSVEDAARQQRYEFLARAAVEVRADRVAVGHTRDDQAETFLLQLLRGAGPRGLSAIHPVSGNVVRPLLAVSRAAVRDYLGDRGVAFREDETNQDPAILRNRVRHELVPLLERRFSPGIARVLSREAAIARDDAAFLERVAATAAQEVLRTAPDGVEFDATALLAQDAAVSRRIARLALMRAAPGRFIGFDHVEALLRFASRERRGHAVDLPGISLARAGVVVRVVARPSPRPARISRPGANSFRVSLSIPGEAVLPAAGRVVSAERADWPSAGVRCIAGLPAVAPDVAVVDAAALPSSLAVRGRRPGDAFRPLGLGGRKKLHDFLIDRKVPRGERDRIPLVVDDRDRIVWVAGHRIAEEFRVTPGTDAVVILKLKNGE